MAYSSITKPTDYFNTVLYTGTGSQLAVTGVGFQPDWIWFKNRGTTNSHGLQDSVRGFNTTGIQSTNGTDADPAFNGNTLGYVSAVGSDGFTVEAGNCANASSNNYVAWNWLAGGSSSSNSDGSITSTVSANTTAGFSIVKYTGTGSNATVGHGLGSAPKMVIVKCTSQSDGWFTYNENIGAGNYVRLDQTIASSSASTLWNSTDSTSSVFSLGTNGGINGSSRTYIAYCFAEKKGYSKLGSYTGNGASSPNEPFVYLGFKPAMIIYKRASDGTNNWSIFDNKRDPHNEIEKQLNPNLFNAEGTSSRGDFLSNGWKVGGGNSGSVNNSGSTYIYMAFAESPFVANDSGTAVPVTAR